MPTFINKLDYPSEILMLCFLWASQHLRELLRVTMIIIILVTGYYLKQWLQHCNGRINHLSRELAQYKARILQNGDIIQFLATENNKMRRERPKVEAYLEESVHTSLAVRCRGPSGVSGTGIVGLTGISRKEDLLLPQDPEDRKCIICLADFTWNEGLTVLPCGHIFHSSCLRTWLEQSFTCAHCQRRLRWVMALTAARRSEMTWRYARNAVTEIEGFGGV